jgi:hypothetical protein
MVKESTASTTNGTNFSVSACVDVSHVNVVDSSGKSVVSAERPDMKRYVYDVQKAPEGFFVMTDTLEGRAC